MLGLFALFLAIGTINAKCNNLFDENCKPNLKPPVWRPPGDEWLEGLTRHDDKELLKYLAEYAHRAHMVVTKRCANLFDEGCINGGIPGANNDEEWLAGLGKRSAGKRCANLFDEGCANGGIPGANGDEEWLSGLGKRSPTRRCANLFDEGCANGGIPGANADEEWLGGLGKRDTDENPGFFKSMSDFFNRVHLVTSKRCANLFDNGCANGGIPEAGKDESWLNGLGKRNVQSEKSIYKSLSDLFNRLDMVRDKRCANLFDEGCINGGIPGANNDEEWLSGLGKRNVKTLPGLLQRIHMRK